MSPSCRRWVLLSLLGLACTGPSWAEGPRRAGGRVDAPGDPLPPGAVLRLGTARFRTGGFSVALSPDGKLIAAASGDIDLLDAATGKVVRRCRADNFDRGEMTFSPDSKLLAASDYHGLHLYDVVTGNSLGRLVEAGRDPGPVVFSADSKLMTAWGGNHTRKTSVCVWEVATRKKIADLSVAKFHWARGALSPDGKILAAWGEPSRAPGDLTVRPVLQFWDLASKKELRRLAVGGHGCAAVTFSPDGKHLAVAESPPAVSVWEVATGKQFRRSAARRGTGQPFAYSPDGKVLAAGSEDGVMQTWDAATGRRIALTPGPQCALAGLAFRPGNRALALGLSYHAIRLWEVPSGKVLTPRGGHQAAVEAVGFLPDGKTAFSAAADGVRFWAAATGNEIRRFVARERDGREIPRAYLPAPGGKYLAWGERYGGAGLRIRETAPGQEVFTLEGSTNLRRGEMGVAFSAGGEILAQLGEVHTPNGRDPEVVLWDLATGRELHRLQDEGWMSYSLALSPDGTRVALAVNELHTGVGGKGPITHVAGVRVWDVSTGKRLARFVPPGGWVAALAFSPDGAVLATAGNGSPVRLWDVGSGRELGRMEAEEGLVCLGLLFSPDGRTLAATTWGSQRAQRKVVVWEVVSRKARSEFLWHQWSVTALAFSPDGRTLATGGADTTVLLWDLFRRDAGGKGRPSAQELEGLWADLAGLDAARAHRAMRRLAAAPREAVALLGKHVRPAAGKTLDQKEIERLIADLDSDSFKTREKASQGLRRVGRPARDALVKALAAKPSLEKKRRLEELIDALSRAAGPSPEMVQPTRALEVLERVGTPEARKVLEALAGGNPGARLTREAKATLERLARRPAPSP